jgi:hypothetical protein
VVAEPQPLDELSTVAARAQARPRRDQDLGGLVAFPTTTTPAARFEDALRPLAERGSPLVGENRDRVRVAFEEDAFAFRLLVEHVLADPTVRSPSAVIVYRIVKSPSCWADWRRQCRSSRGRSERVIEAYVGRFALEYDDEQLREDLLHRGLDDLEIARLLRIAGELRDQAAR